MIIAVAADALCWIGPKAHQLRHGRGEAAHDGVTARSGRVFRATVIVWIGLIPLSLAKIARSTTVARDQPTMLKHGVPFRCHFRSGHSMTKPQHALCNSIQIIHQRWRDVGSIESRLVGIADDGTMGIVARNDNETVFSDIEDKERLVCTRVNKFGHGAFSDELRRGKFLCRNQGNTTVNRPSM